MDPVLVLPVTDLAVEPGAEARATVKVRNAGSRVEEYALSVLGATAAWSEVVPAQVSVYPGTDVEVTVVFRPPRDPSTPSGAVPFGVLCRSRENEESSAVVEGDLQVGATLEFQAQLLPQASTGRWRGRHRVDFDNRGSAPVRVKLAASDPASALAFALAPENLEIQAGGKAHAFLQVRTREPVLRGTPKQHRFQVSYHRMLTAPGEPPEASSLDGTFTQKPILSKLVVGAAVVLVVAAVALAAMALTRDESEPEDGGPIPVAAPEIRSLEPRSDRVHLAWDADPNATGYVVQLMEGEGDDAKVADQRDVERGQDSFVWDELEEDAPYCFRLVAVAGERRSRPSEAGCTETAPLAALDPPATFEVLPRDGELKVDVSWAPVEGAEHIILIDGAAAGEPYRPGIAEGVIDVPSPGTYRFSIVVKMGEREAPPALERAVEIVGDGSGGEPPSGGGNGGDPPIGGVTTTEAGQDGTTTTTTTGGGGVEAVGWVAILGEVLVDDPNADDLVDGLEDRQVQLAAEGIDATLATNADAGIERPGADAHLLYVDGLEEDQARALCAGRGDCTVEEAD